MGQDFLDIQLPFNPTLQLLLEDWNGSNSCNLYWDTVVHGMCMAKEALLSKTAQSRVICCIADPSSSCLSIVVRVISYQLGVQIERFLCFQYFVSLQYTVLLH